jgi:hypothetical protein
MHLHSPIAYREGRETTSFQVRERREILEDVDWKSLSRIVFRRLAGSISAFLCSCILIQSLKPFLFSPQLKGTSINPPREPISGKQSPARSGNRGSQREAAWEV